jgi:hypothetical protein
VTFPPLNSGNSLGANFNQINNIIREINSEQQTKVFKGPNNVNALISGKLPNNLGYGFQFSDTNKVPRIIAYIDANDNPVFKVSQSGVDVTTATNAQLIFNSAQNVFKIVATGTSTFPAASTSLGAGGGWAGDFQTTQINHGLGHIPIVFAIRQGSTTYAPIPSSTIITNAFGAEFLSFTAYADATKVYLGTHLVINSSTSASASYGPFNCRYYLLQETAN